MPTPTREELDAALARLPQEKDGSPVVYRTKLTTVAMSPALYEWLSDYSAVTSRSMRSLVDEAVRCLRDHHAALVTSGQSEQITRNDWIVEAADALVPVRPATPER